MQSAYTVKNGEKWEKHKKKEDTAVEWDDKFEKWKHLSGFCKTYAEIQEDCKFYLKHVKVTNKCFMFNCLIKKQYIICSIYRQIFKLLMSILKIVFQTL